MSHQNKQRVRSYGRSVRACWKPSRVLLKAAPKALRHVEASQKQASKGINSGLQCSGLASPLSLLCKCLFSALLQRICSNAGRQCRLRLRVHAFDAMPESCSGLAR